MRWEPKIFPVDKASNNISCSKIQRSRLFVLLEMSFQKRIYKTWCFLIAIFFRGIGQLGSWFSEAESTIPGLQLYRTISVECLYEVDNIFFVQSVSIRFSIAFRSDLGNFWNRTRWLSSFHLVWNFVYYNKNKNRDLSVNTWRDIMCFISKDITDT